MTSNKETLTISQKQNPPGPSGERRQVLMSVFGKGEVAESELLDSGVNLERPVL